MNDTNDDDFLLLDLVIDSVGKSSTRHNANAFSNRWCRVGKRLGAAKNAFDFSYEVVP